MTFVLGRQFFAKLGDRSQGVRLAFHHEVGESDGLVNQLVVLEAGLVEEPLLPFVVPRRDRQSSIGAARLHDEFVEVSLSLSQRLPISFELVEDGMELKTLGLLDVEDVLEEATVLGVLVVAMIDFVDVDHIQPEILQFKWLSLLQSLNLSTVQAANLDEGAEELGGRQAGIFPHELVQLLRGEDSQARRVLPR